MSNPNISLGAGFHYDEVDPKTEQLIDPAAARIISINPGLAGLLATRTTLSEQNNVVGEPLGDLIGFVNSVDPTRGLNFAGRGFNTIFRPQNLKTPACLPIPVAGDNVLELNLTTETLSFSPPLGNVPNRGSGEQPDIFLNAVPYVQSVNDVTSLPTTGIHFEPGMWLSVPPTTQPAEAAMTYSRMASIPHGVTINAQGISLGRTTGKPDFTLPALQVNINPFSIGGAQPPAGTHPFASQDVTNGATARIPQDLTSFVNAGTITQQILDNPNIVLMNEIASQNMRDFVTLVITTDAAGTLPTPPPDPTNPPAQPSTRDPGFAGGTAEIAFLTGDNNTPPQKPNAHAFKMTAVFWIETVLETIVVPVCQANGLPITIQAAPRAGSDLRPLFTVTPINDITDPKEIVVPFTQIQYSQTVFLNFNTLTWPHVSVATLIPADPIVVPASLLA